MMKKLKAFTVLELIVSMAISTMLIGTCFLAYQIIINQFTNYKITSQRTQDIVLCNYLLTRDINMAGSISQPEQGVFRLENGKTIITYTFELGYILRAKENSIDTFHLKTVDLETKEVTLLNSGGMQNLVTDMQFSLADEQEIFNLHFRKEYSPHILINAEDYIGN